MSVRILNRSFSGGEVTPELFGRLDLPKVQEALALCMNFITLPHGPVVNRPGTEYVEEVKNSANPTRLIPFSYNNTQTFAIQLGAGYFRLHTQGATVQAAGSAWSGTTAYLPNDLVTASSVTYSCITANTNQNPVEAAWSGATSYTVGNLASYNGVTYLCAQANTNVVPPNAAYWTPLWRGTTYTSLYTYNPGDLAISAGSMYYCLFASSYNPVQTAWSNVTAYNVNDRVSYNGFTYLCAIANTGQTPSYSIPPNPYWTPLWYALPANGDYEIPNFYAAADLFSITYTQSADVLTLCHQNYPILELRRYGATNWQLRQVTFGSQVVMPIGSGGLPGTAIAHVYGVQAFVPHTAQIASYLSSASFSAMGAAASINNDLTQAGAYNLVSWNGVAGGAGYIVYKQVGGIWYQIGTAYGLTFRDDSSITVSTTTQRVSDGTLIAPVPTATAYPASGTAASVTAAPTVASGTGFVVYSYVVTAVDESGNESYPSNMAGCSNNLLTQGNYNTITVPYVSSAVRYNIYKLSSGAWGFIGQAAFGTIAAGGSATFIDQNITPDISRTPPLAPSDLLNTANHYPGAVAYYQQRRFFGGSANQVQNVWATRSGTESDMNYTIPSRDDNRLAFKIASREGSAIRHIVPLQDLLILSASCEWKCSSTTGVLTPATLNVQPQSYIGANNVQPVVVGNAVLYGAARGGHIRQMNYNWQINGYQSTDSSIFAPHLFDYNTIVDMAYSKGPIPILWCVSSSGKLLGMTYLPEQQIASWHQHATGAADVFESVCIVSEAPANSTAIEDMLYCIVRRTINGATHRFVERLHTRLYNSVADCHYVDCGMTYNLPAANTGAFTRSGSTITCTINGHGFTNTTGQTAWLSFSDATYGALPNGTQYAIGYVDANTFTVSLPVAPVAISIAAPAVVAWNGHGLAAGAPVAFSTTGTLPSGIVAGTTYYVVTPTANTFQIAATPGGAAIATSGTQSGTQSCYIAAAASGTVTHLPHIISGLAWLQGMTVNILADGAVIPPQVVSQAQVGNVPPGSIVLPVGASQVHVGLPLTAQLQTPPAAAQLDPAFAQGRAKNVNKAFLRVYRSSGILAGPDFADLTPYRQRSTENPGSPPNLVTDEMEIVLTPDWGQSGQICIQQSDPLPLDIASMTLEIAVGGGV